MTLVEGRVVPRVVDIIIQYIASREKWVSLKRNTNCIFAFRNNQDNNVTDSY